MSMYSAMASISSGVGGFSSSVPSNVCVPHSSLSC
jgi:hypothetical protein